PPSPSDQEQPRDEMAALAESGGAAFLQSLAKRSASSGQDSQQTSPLALLAATCSRMESPGEGEQAGSEPPPPPQQQQQQQHQHQQQLDLNSAQIAHTANGWQLIPVSVPSSVGATTLSQAGGLGGDAASAPTLQGQQVLTTLSGVMPNIQYQVIPQFQTVDGQQLQFATATGASAQVSMQQDSAGQFQLVSSPGGGQQIIRAAGGAGAGGGNLIAMPNLLQQAIPLQNLGLGSNLLQNQGSFLANVPLSLNGNITLLPVSAGGQAAAGGAGDAGSGASLQQQQQVQQAVSSAGAQTITLAPVQSLPQLAQSPAGAVTVNAAQLSGLQTINLNTLSSAGLQMHQLPIAIANPAGGRVPLIQKGGGEMLVPNTFGQAQVDRAQQEPSGYRIVVPLARINGKSSQPVLQVSQTPAGALVVVMARSVARKHRALGDVVAVGPVVNLPALPLSETVGGVSVRGSVLALVWIHMSFAKSALCFACVCAQIAGSNVIGEGGSIWLCRRKGVKSDRRGERASALCLLCSKLPEVLIASDLMKGTLVCPDYICGAGAVETSSSVLHLLCRHRWPALPLPRLFCSYQVSISEPMNANEKSQSGSEKKFTCPECPKRFMRSDHLSKHIKTHQNKKGNGTAPSNSLPVPVETAPVSEAGVASDQHALITMETLSPEGIARLASSGINVMQVADLHSINMNNGY
uniref:Sp1 transcription factor n=1 Tax=Lepisosteus oculatus TaxID=7918 RepID=W5MEM1_LEPOC